MPTDADFSHIFELLTFLDAWQLRLPDVWKLATICIQSNLT